jgi:hypothetical protein
LVSSPFLFDDGICVGCPDEGLWVLVVLGDEAVDGLLEVGDATKTPRFKRLRVSLAKKASTA